VALNKYVLPFLMDTWNGTVPVELDANANDDDDNEGPALQLDALPSYIRMTRE
jgi:hypothetical protein